MTPAAGRAGEMFGKEVNPVTKTEHGVIRQNPTLSIHTKIVHTLKI